MRDENKRQKTEGKKNIEHRAIGVRIQESETTKELTPDLGV